ncbi:MAG: hypothetical protein E7608_02915, partial [Ruminococcaceae bacterium]|nr:hypothetical protein [Oscillospiraceae bacterium]
YDGAEAYGWIPINMDLCGITPFTKSGLLLDNIHPNEAGTEKIVEYLSEELASYGANSKKQTILFNHSSVSIENGKTTTLKAVLSPRSGNGSPVFTWSSSNSSVATVDANGKITAVAHGNATITATADNDVSATVQVYVAEGEHTYESTVTAPTCTEQGYTTYTCECGESYVDAYVESTGHRYLGKIIENTCPKENYVEFTCSVCGESYCAKLTADKLTEEAFVGKTITVVGDSITAGTGGTAETKYVAVLGKLLGATIVNKGQSGATMTTEAYGTAGNHLTSQLEKLINTDYNTDYLLVALGVNDWRMADRGPTIKLGTLGGTDTTTIYGAFNVAMRALSEKYSGTDIKVFFATPTPAFYEGTLSDDVMNKEGYTAADVCRAIKETAALYGIPVVDMHSLVGFTDANAERFLMDTVHPNEAGHERIAEIWADFLLNNYSYQSAKVVQHTVVIDKSVTPTCTATGLTEGKHCSACGEILVPQEIVEALSHSYNAVVTAPTCTEKGYTTHTCACGDSYVDSYVDALGHKFGQYISNDDATVTSDGTKTAVCERDGCKATDTVTDAGTKLLLGDMNNDKCVDTDDAIYLLRHILMPDSYCVKQSANVNGDDVADTDDAIYLLRHVLLPNSYPLKPEK